MAERKKEDRLNSEPENETTKPKVSTKGSCFRRFWSFHGLVILFLGIITLQGAVLIYYYGSNGSLKTPLNAEISLGKFCFKADEGEQGHISNAEFGLHIALLQQVAPHARHQLAIHQFRVQQDIEELLRQAHSGDFDDPTLGELKRQLQEQINETLGMRAIADVIITDLRLGINKTEIAAPSIETAEMVPWVEKPSS